MNLKFRQLTGLMLIAGFLSFHQTSWAEDTKAAEAAPAKSDDHYFRDALKKMKDEHGLEIFGYMRTGLYKRNSVNGQKINKQFQLGGPLSHYRLGNENDTFGEFGIAKTFKLNNGLKIKGAFMPYVYNGPVGKATLGVKQLYGEVSGFKSNPDLAIWAGQRYHRIQDIHIIDQWLVEDGDNLGVGVDGIKLGNAGKLNVAAHVAYAIPDNNTSIHGIANKGARLNVQWRDIPVNPGGKLNVTGGIITGKYVHGSDGYAVGLLHNQSDFIVKGLTNSLFVQRSSGHASLNGKFLCGTNKDTVETPCGGAKQNLIANSINWQKGKFGGQAVVGYSTYKPDNAETTKNFSIGARFSYGILPHVKLLAEVAGMTQKTKGSSTQRLHKETLAVAYSLGDTDFWTRPELRLYYTHAKWNQAAAAANIGNFGGTIDNVKTSGNTFGLQLETWW